MDKEAVVHIFSGILLSNKKEKNNAIFSATGMDLETVILSEGNQTQKDKYRMTSLICEI